MRYANHLPACFRLRSRVAQYYLYGCLFHVVALPCGLYLHFHYATITGMLGIWPVIWFVASGPAPGGASLPFSFTAPSAKHPFLSR